MQINRCTQSNYAVVRLMPFQLLTQGMPALLVILLIIVLSGCSQMPVSQNTLKNDLPSNRTDGASAEAPDPIKSLLNQSEAQRLKQDYNGALATLERALRINPRNADVWSQMARVYLDQGNWEQAKQHAKRSNSVIKNNARLKAFNNQIIENKIIFWF